MKLYVLSLLVSQLFNCATPAPAEMANGRCANPASKTAMPAYAQAHGLMDLLGASVDIDLRIHIGPHNEAALDAHLMRLYDPKSPDFHKFVTPEQFRSLYGPSPMDVHHVLKHLASQGIDTVGTIIRGNIVHVHTTVGKAEQAFAVRIHQIPDGRGHAIYATHDKPSWPDDVPIHHVDGLSQKPRRHTHIKKPHDIVTGGLSASVIRSAYNVPDSATGQGQTLGIMELDGYDPGDLDTYAAQMGIRRVPTTNILVNHYDGTVHDPGAQVEVTMDIQLANALAPDLDEIRVYEADNGDHSMLDIFNEAANPSLGDRKLVHVFSLSWGSPEDQMSASDVLAENAVLRQMAAQGQTVFVAAGDSGATDDGSALGTDDPASQPWAVAVGGTTLTVLNGIYQNETTWSGGGGGISCYWKAPAWQVGHEGIGSGASITNRDVPDIALNADPATGYAVYVAGNWQVVGGTSCAAPLWAAFATLVDERRHSLGLGPLGFFARALYRTAATPGGKAGLHDIADNSTNGYYPAVVGLDDATGWGSFNGAPLLEALSLP